MIKVFTKNIENISNARVQEHYRALSRYRKTKADKCRNGETFLRSVEAGYLLEKSFSDFFGIPAGRAEYEIGAHGKPFIKGRPDVIFSISHTRNAVMAVLAIDEKSKEGVPCVAVGCDIEQVRERKADRKLAKSLFSKEEYEYVMKNGGFDPEAFLKIWTIKESFGKALGKGLSLSLSDIKVSFDEQGELRTEQSLHDGDAVFMEAPCYAEGCVNAICVLYKCRKG